MKNSHISWTDHTFNPWEGCTKVSPGCANCYAENRNARFGGGTAPNWGKGAPRRRTSVSNWNQPLKWDREAGIDALCAKHILAEGDASPERVAWARANRRPRVFCASLADWLDDEVPIDWLADLLDLIRRTPHLDWLLLTKRPHNWKKRLMAAYPHSDTGFGKRTPSGGGLLLNWLDGTPPANVWVGTSVEDQARADERIPLLLDIPAKVRFLSMEPLLGAVEIDKNYWLTGQARREDKTLTPPGSGPRIHWVIVGGESGPHARPMHPDWARSLRDQCKAAGVAFHFKQWGEHDHRTIRMGKKVAGRLLDGVEHNEFPGGAS